MDRRPLLSVIIPIWNEANALPCTFQRLLANRFQHEIIVVGGGSQDATRELAGCAILTDTDNTRESVTAYYGDILVKKK